MFDRSRTAVSILLAIGLAGALAGSWTGPASAASGQISYLGECSGSAAPAAPTASNQAKLRPLPRHGSWTAVMIGEGAMIVDEFDNGAKFAILAYPGGKFSVLLTHPEWRLQRAQQLEMTIRIDGEVYKGKAVANDRGMLEVDGVSKALVMALYCGRQGRIEIADYRFDMTNLADAAAAIDDAIAHLKTALR